MATTNKTKAELLEEIEVKNAEIKELKELVKDLERYETYNDMAREISAMRMAFENAGLSKKESFEMVLELSKIGMNMASPKRLF